MIAFQERIPYQADSLGKNSLLTKAESKAFFTSNCWIGSLISHYHAERNHQALGNRLIDPGDEVGRTTGEIACRERLGGILRYYYRKTA
jgi:hypothetical protein